MKRAFVFPGQGSQFPGMGKALAEASSVARHLFQEIDDALSQHLSRLMFDGPESHLTLHGNAGDRAIAIAAGRGAGRRILLPVGPPFHPPLMPPAAEMREEALAEFELGAPAVPLVANVTARETTDPAEIKELLVEQVTRMVRWRESVLLFARNEVEEVVEIGVGRVLAGLVKRIERDLAAVSVGAPAEIDELVKRL